jgi:hypothetical protein
MKICYPQRYRVTTDTGAPVCEGSLDTVIECLNNIQGCNVPIQPNPVLSLDANNNAVITETGNCPDPNVVLYGYTITDTTTNTVLFNTTAAATVADITNTLANLQSDAGLVISGVNCPQTNSFADPKTSFLNNVSQGGNVIMSNIDLTDANQISALEQAIKGYLAANGGTIFDTVTITFDGTTVTINIVSSVAGFTLLDGANTVVFTETASAVSIPCIGCYEITIYATPCDGSGNATIMGNSLFFTIIPLMHDGGDVYYFDGSPINVYSPFSNNLLGNGSTVQQIDDLLNNDPDKPAGVIFTGLTNSSDSSGSYEIAVGNACVNAPFIGVEPVPISLALVSQTGGQVLNGYVATNPYPTEYNFAYSSDGINFTPQATWDAVTGNNVSHDFGSVVFGNGNYVRLCVRYVGAATETCDIRQIPKPVVTENVYANGDYAKIILNQTPDAHAGYIGTDFTEILTVSGHNTADGNYTVEVTDTSITVTPPLPMGLTVVRVGANSIQVAATAAFLADNTGSITIDETDIFATHKYTDIAQIGSVTAATETYSYSALFDCWVSPNVDQAALSLYRNIIVNGVTYNTATYTGSDITLYVAEVLSLGIAGLVNAAYVPKKVTISFNSSAAITSVEFEADVQVGTFSVLPFTQSSANQPTPCV